MLLLIIGNIYYYIASYDEPIKLVYKGVYIQNNMNIYKFNKIIGNKEFICSDSNLCQIFDNETLAITYHNNYKNMIDYYLKLYYK
jgi:hypothetical protein